jgi:hypothetical protein
MLDHVNLRVADYERSRTFYHPNYYGAFVLDPDGYNIEAVCRKAE